MELLIGALVFAMAVLTLLVMRKLQRHEGAPNERRISSKDDMLLL